MGGRARSVVLAAVVAVCLSVAAAPDAAGDDRVTMVFGVSGADLAQPAAKRKPPVARAGLVSKRRRSISKQRYLRVRIRTTRPASVRLFATARPRGRKKALTVTKRRLIKMRKRGSRVVRLRLTARGRRTFAGCRTLGVRPAGKFRARRAKKSRRLRPGVTRIKPDAIRCGSGAGRFEPLGKIDTGDAENCDFLDPAVCLYPFPSNRFARPDPTTPTGRRLALPAQSMPKNRAGRPIDSTDQNRADGYSPGNLIVTKVPGLDNQDAFRRTGAVPITDMARSFDTEAPVVVINARTGQRQLIWAEVDSNPANRRDATLIIRPGKNFEEGERYIVALRRLRNENGEILPPREEFRAYRDDLKTQNKALESRRGHFEEIFADLARANIGRRDLYLAWDFTVASRQSLTGRALAIRNDAFAQLGDTNLADLQVQGASPQFIQNADIPDNLPDPQGNDGRRDFPDGNIARRITGQLMVPCYLDQPNCPPGSGFTIGPDGNPQRTPGNTALANVICTIPRRAVDGSDPARSQRPSLYGHGLLGSGGEVGGGNVQAMGQEHGFVFCATDWVGMSTSDLPNVASLLQDLSRFNTLVDRIEQGYVNFMYLGRWMIHPQGASANPAFQSGGQSVINTERLFYDGNSQGGILSGGLTALSPDFQRAVHGVPGMNYSTLLRRSVDFDLYANGDFTSQARVPVGLYQSYPNELERPLVLSAIQLLWDRGESNGYAQHMTDDPLPNTPPHQVLLHPAFGDHQVANVAADVEARSIGASAYRPAVFPGRSPDVTPLVGIPTAPASGFTGSAIVYWDGGPLGRMVNNEERGTPAPPTGNVPPRAGKDPHSYPRSDVKARQQKAEFMKVGGTLFNPCGIGPCYADGYTGP